MAQLCGGWTPMVQPAGSEVQELCNSVIKPRFVNSLPQYCYAYFRID